MKLSVWFTYVVTIVVTLFSAVPSVKADEAATDSQSIVRPRFGLDFDSASGGAEPFSQFESFVPIWQTVDSDLVFFQGQLSFDTDANLGTNLQLGYRRFVPNSDRIYGGYLAFDKRGTDAASFDQLGVGIETLGENWDLRLNGYLPLGDRRDLVDSNVADAGTQISDLAFVGNLLTATSTPRQADVREYESALGGFDLEVGTKLLDIGEQGALRGFGGLYYYDGPAVGGSLGWRARLQAEPTNYLRTGIAVQNDDIFGTNVRFNIGAVLPRRQSIRTESGEVDSVRSRLSESIGRDGHIVVDRQREIAISEIEADEITAGPVINPATGRPWFFDHVVEGSTGDGTFEAPHGTLESAIATAPTDGNGIIYITNSENLSGPITLPGGVQVLTSGPEQFIDAFGSAAPVQLPFSGSGEFPVISGAVRLESNPEAPTIFDGFTVEDAATETSEEETSEEINGGIFADNSFGEIIIRNNVVTTAGSGIEVASSEVDTAGGVTISGNSIAGENAGIQVATTEATLTGDIVVSDNVAGQAGIRIDTYESNRTGNLTISGNTVDTTGVDTTDVDTTDSGDEDSYGLGINLTSRDSSVDGNVVISGNTVDTNETGIATRYSYSELAGELVISDNQIGTADPADIEAAPSGGINIFTGDSRISDGITISGNTINAQSVGIGIVSYSGGPRGPEDPDEIEDPNEIEPGIGGGVTISGNTAITVAGDADRGASFFPSGNSVGIGVINGQGSTITGGVSISENGPIRVTGDEEISAVGITVVNNQGTVEGGVEITNNESIVVNGADTDFTGLYSPSPEDFGTVGIAVGNNAYSYGSSTIDGGITISGNTDINSSEYGIAVVNNAQNYSYDASAIVTGDITITGNGVTSTDDSVLIVNLDEVSGSVSVSENLLISIEDDSIDFSNLSSASTINGDVAFFNNTFEAAGDDIKCTNNGTITGTVSPISVTCQSPLRR